MKRAILLLSISVCGAFAQPPGLLRVIRQGTIQPYAAGQARVNVLAMSGIAGPAENWLIEMHDSFASLESVDQSLAAAAYQGPDATLSPDPLAALSRSVIATYRPGLSYRPDEGIKMISKMRYLDVALLRIKPGDEADLAKLLRLRSVSLDSVNVDRPEIVYRIIAGAPEGTYLVLAPMTSLRGLDNGRASPPDYGEAAEDTAKKLAAAIELVREHFWFRVDPGMSYVSDEFASQDPNFWRPQK